MAGGQAARWQRVRRKRFLEPIRADEIAVCVQIVTRTAEGSALAAALGRWLGRAETPCLPEALPDGGGDERVRCSVIINTVDRASQLAVTLADLKAVWKPETDELIVVLGPTGDNSREVIAACGIPHRLVSCAERNLSLSRNAGLLAARGNLIAYLDDDASPEPGWLDALLAPLLADSVAEVAAGFVLDGGGTRFLDQWVVADDLGRSFWCGTENEAAATVGRIGASRAFLRAVGCNMAFRRRTLLAHGGFDTGYRYFLEETDIARRMGLAGGRCVVAPESRVRHRLGANAARSADVSPEERLTVARSLVHYLGRFAFNAFTPDEIRGCVWRRVLLDLERIAWEAGSAASVGEGQRQYLRMLAETLV